MLYEINNVKRRPQDQFRRWFANTDMDLFIWFERQVPVGFQLSYDKQTDEKAICWKIENGFQHFSVDSGEVEPLKYKMSPLYSADGEFDTRSIARAFLRNSENIEASLADFIYARLLEYHGPGKRWPNRDAVSSNF